MSQPLPPQVLSMVVLPDSTAVLTWRQEDTPADVQQGDVGLCRTEIWGGSLPDRAQMTFLAVVRTTPGRACTFYHHAPPSNAPWHYWLRTEHWTGDKSAFVACAQEELP